MSFGALLMLLGTVLGVVLGLLLLGVLVVVAFHLLDERFNGIPRLRRELGAAGFLPGLVQVVADDASLHAPSIAWPALVLVSGLAGLGYGLYELAHMYAATLDEQLLYAAPGLVISAFGLYAFVRNLLKRGHTGPAYRALVADPARTRLVVVTRIQLLLNDTTVGEALTGTRAAVWRAVPHCVLIRDDGEEIRLRHDHDPALPHAIQRALPHARALHLPSWRDGSGRALLSTGALA